MQQPGQAAVFVYTVRLLALVDIVTSLLHLILPRVPVKLTGLNLLGIYNL